MNSTLVILAAGVGSRYGDLKQLEVVGPGGVTIMDYSIYDALRAGFGKIVFVIRPDMEAAFRATVGQRYKRRVPVAYALQRLDALPLGFAAPPGRTKPWGTGHAVLAAERLVKEPFAVVNADDFYGAGAYVGLSDFLRREEPEDVPTYAMVGYALRDTLTETGAVNRGCCRCTPDGWLERIIEVTHIERHGSDGRYPDESGKKRILSGDQIVSMNAWGFRPVFFDQLRARFECFLRENAVSETAEFYLPAAIQDLMLAGHARVKVLPTKDTWAGITHSEDKPRVIEMISELIRRGRYPHRLWG
jgi:dTDP-glucose pyrophosphorylase